MSRLRRADHPAPLNAATFEANFRMGTAKLVPLVVPKMRRCGCCNRLRTERQYIPSSPHCENCRRPR